MAPVLFSLPRHGARLSQFYSEAIQFYLARWWLVAKLNGFRLKALELWLWNLNQPGDCLTDGWPEIRNEGGKIRFNIEMSRKNSIKANQRLHYLLLVCSIAVLNSHLVMYMSINSEHKGVSLANGRITCCSFVIEARARNPISRLDVLELILLRTRFINFIFGPHSKDIQLLKVKNIYS